MDSQNDILTRAPGLRPSSILLIALSLSIGWGIRGNFGHEYGAMIAGALSVSAACLVSGRDDWRRRIPFFVFFGTVGWAFGGSISYMQVIAYTHSGHLPSQVYGFFCLFVIGFLWAGMGGAGAALPAVANREQLTRYFKPICFVFGAWAILVAALPVIEQFEDSYTQTWGRHESPLYWFDADWIQAVTALAGLAAFDLWDRRFGKAYWLPVFGGVGAVLGWGAQRLLSATGLIPAFLSFFVRHEGDASAGNLEDLLINWPQGFADIPQHVGWILGIAAGITVYFTRFGTFRCGASLFVHMAMGWIISFLILPTLLGVRMTPPRADDWAGILGLFVGAAIYFLRNGMAPVVFASVVSGTIGGLGFSGMQLLKLLCTAPGNSQLCSDPATVERWAHWQSANWHSFLEQTYGFVNGIAIAVALGLLATRTKPVNEDQGQRKWTEVFGVAFVLFGLTFLNLFKNVEQWVKGGVPETMHAPLFGAINLSAELWFFIIYALMAGGGIAVMCVHLRRRIAAVPSSWIGKGQLLFLVFLWAMVIGNFERALMGFREGRLLTEGVIFVNAVIVSIMILLCPREGETLPNREPKAWRPLVTRAIIAAFLALLAGVAIETGMTRLVYGDRFTGHASMHKRFGPDATWRVKPLRKGEKHL